MDRRKALRNTGLIAGATVAAPSLLVLLDSCKAESRLDWQPSFLTDSEAQCLSALVDTILPRTDTPGALDVKADVFLDKVFAQVYDESGQKSIRADIAKFDADCVKSHGSTFASLSAEDKTAVLKAHEANSPKYNGTVWGTAVGKQEPVGFYRSIKSMSLWAFFTSQKIGKETLNYDPIPQEYDGCKPLADVGYRWSL